MIRPAKPKDAPQAIPLIIQAVGRIALTLTGAATLNEASPVLEAWFVRERNRHSYQNTIVFDQNGILAGLVVAYDGASARGLDEPLEIEAAARLGKPNHVITTEAESNEFYLDTLSVHSEFQGRGLGRQLIEAIFPVARQHRRDRIGLLVKAENSGAQRLYQSLEFEQVGQKLIGEHPYGYWVRRL